MDRKFYAHTKKGKPESEWQELKDHLKSVSKKTAEFTNKIGLEDCGKILGLLHDFGKYSAEFQQYLLSAEGLINPDEDDIADLKGLKGKIDHSTAGAQYLHNYLSALGQKGNIASQILNLCLVSHHSNLIDCITPEGNDNYCRRIKKQQKKTHLDEVVLNLDKEIKKEVKELFLNNNIIECLLNKLNSLKDDLDSQDTLLFKTGLLVRFLLSCLLDADRLDTADFENPIGESLRNNSVYINWEQLVSKFNLYLTKFQTGEPKSKIDLRRQEISELCYASFVKDKGTFQLTVPTGGGKTLASLRFALNHAKLYNLDRIFYVIPFTSIIDQNAGIAREALEDKNNDGNFLTNIVLEHHSNLTPDEETYRQKLLAENWDSPVVFTTSVQFLEALFGNGTGNARRMHQLANAVIIFDEVQTMPVRCIHMFNLALRFLTHTCGSSIVLCTATQPLLDKLENKSRSIKLLPERRMIPDVNKLFNDLKRVKVIDSRKAEGWREDEINNLVEEEINISGSVLIIVNTKESARKLYIEMQRCADARIYHLSTDMCPAHRSDVFKEIKECLEKKEKIICISTQLIEAGVDIDFGSVIRYLAGLDSIAQAAGRCNRNDIKTTGNVFIINPANENLNRLKDIKIAAEITKRVLDEYKDNPEQFENDIISPITMERFYKYYFYDRSNDMKYNVGKNSKIGRDDDLFNLLSVNSLSVEAYKRINSQKIPDLLLKQAFKSASEVFKSIDNSGIGVIVPYGNEGKEIINNLCAKENPQEQYKVLKRAQRYSINVFPYIFDELLSAKAIYEVQKESGIYYLDSQYYSKDFGLSKEPVNNREVLITSKED